MEMLNYFGFLSLKVNCTKQGLVTTIYQKI